MAAPEKKTRIVNKLKQTEARYRELFDSINVCVAVFKTKNDGEDFIIKDFNTAAEKVEKISRQDVIGKSIFEVYPWIREYGIFEVMQRVWKTGVPEHFPTKFYRDNRVRGWRSSYIYKLPSGDIVGVYQDVTDSMKALAALKEAEVRYRTVADFTYDWEFWIGSEGKFKYVSPSCKRITGYPPGQFFKKPNFMDKLVMPEDRHLWTAHQQKFRGGIAGECIFRIKSKDGQVRWIEQVCVPIIDDNGQFQGTRGSNRDVTDRRQADQALRDSEEKFHAIAEQSVDIIFTTDAHGTLTYVSPECRNALRYEPAEMTGGHFTEFLSPDSMDAALTAFSNALTGKARGRMLELKMKRKDGSVFLGELNGGILKYGNSKGIAGIIRDITARKAAEDALRKSEALLREKEAMFRVVFGNHYQLTGLLDPEGRLLAANSTALSFAGVTEDNVIGKCFWETPWWQHSAEVRKQLKSAIKDASTGEFIHFETSHVNEKSEIRQMAFSLNPVIDSAGKVIYIIPEGRDISEFLKSQQTVKDSEEKYRSIFENAGEAIYIAAGDRIVFANKRTFEITRYPQEELLGRPFADFIHPADREMVVTRYLARLQGKIIDPVYSFRFLGGDGSLLYFELRATPIEWEGKPSTLNFVTDITTRKKAEEAIEHSNRRLADIIDFLPDATLVIDDSDKVILWNRGMTELTGVPDSEMLGKGDRSYAIPFYGEARPHLMDLIWPDRADIRARYTNIERCGNSLSAVAFCPALRQGKGAWVFAKTSPLHDKDGNIVGAIESVRDITEQQMAEDALRKSEEQYRLLAENTDDVIWTLDNDLNFTYVSPSVMKLSGYEPDEAMRQGIDETLAPESQKVFRHEIEAIRTNIENGNNMSVRVELQQCRKDGATVWVEAVVRALCNENGKLSGFIGVSRDLSDRKRLQYE